MTKQKREESLTPELTPEQMEERIKELTQTLLIQSDMNNLKDEGYFRRQVLVMLERIAISQERTAEALEEDSSEEEKPKNKSE